MHDLLRDPVRPFEVEEGLTVSGALERMGRTSLQARSLADAAGIWESMLRYSTTVFLGLAGAMVPASMRKVIAYLIEQRFVGAQSWGKVASTAKKVTVYCDATIALPLIVSCLSDRCADVAGTHRVSFEMGGVLTMKVN